MIRKAIPAIVSIVYLTFAAMNVAQAAGAPVYIDKAQLKDVESLMHFPGRVISDKYVSLSAEIDGKLEWVAELGAEVKQGDVVARIQDIQLKISRAGAAQEVKNTQTELDLAINKRDRYKTLSDNHDVSEFQLTTMNSEIDLLRGQLRSAKIKVREIDDLLMRTEIKSPFNGVIARRFKQASEWANSSDPVVSVMDNEILEVSLVTPSGFAAQLELQQTVQVQTEYGAVRGVLRAKMPQPDFRFYELRVALLAQDLPAGISVQVGFPQRGTAEQKIVVPRDALQVRNNALGVFRITEENKAEYVSVKTVALGESWSAIEGDINDGDTIVIRGVERLSHGQEVNVLVPEVDLIRVSQSSTQDKQ